MHYNTRGPVLQRLTRHESDWIFHLMRKNGVRQTDIMRVTGFTSASVSLALNGKRSSLAVYSAVSKLLGYGSFEKLLAAVPKEADGDDTGGRAA